MQVKKKSNQSSLVGEMNQGKGFYEFYNQVFYKTQNKPLYNIQNILWCRFLVLFCFCLYSLGVYYCSLINIQRPIAMNAWS